MTSLRALWGTFLSFSAIQGALIFLPLLALPYLARVLQPDVFGQVLYLLTLAMVVGIFVEWGFALGGARTVATNRTAQATVRAVVYGVLTAKVFLALLCMLGLASFSLVFPSFGGSGPGLAYATAYGIVLGFNPTWYYQGLGQGMRRMALWDVGSSALALLLMFLLIHSPEDGAVYLLLLLGCKGLCYGWLNIGICRQHSPRLFSLHNAWESLMEARVFFFARLASMLYTQGNTLLLGTLLPARELGMLLASDKIAKAVVSVSGPVTQTLFPEVCAMRGEAPQIARRYLRLSLGCAALMGLVATASLWLLAPWVIYIALGPQYAGTVPVLRILCFVIPFLTCNFVLGTQILVPFGQERALVRVLLLVGLVSLPVVALLAVQAGVWGAACMPILVEGSIFCLLVYCVYKKCPEALLASTVPAHEH